MKKILNKIAGVLNIIFGYGIMLALFLGGLSFFGYLVALIIGGDTATAICTFIYKTAYPILVYASSVMILLGLAVMYLRGEKALASDKKKKAQSADKIVGVKEGTEVNGNAEN